MIQRDYILRMIEEFMQFLSRLQSLRRGQLWEEAAAALDDEFRRLTGAGAETVAQLSETELLARLLKGEPTHVVRQKALILTTLLNEAADLAAAQGRPDHARAFRLKSLGLLLDTVARHQPFDFPDFVPRVQALVAALQDQPLSLPTLARLMRHYELTGNFRNAHACLTAMLEAEPDNPALLELGIGFCQRLRGHTDAELAGGNLPRHDLEARLADLRRRSAAGASDPPGRPPAHE
jgi:hypothetical protein